MSVNDARTAMLNGLCEHQKTFDRNRGGHFGGGELVVNECCLTDLFARLAKAEAAAENWRQCVREYVDDMDCLPSCNSHFHDEECPLTNGAAAWRKLRAEVAYLQDDNARLREMLNEVRRESAEVPGASCPSYVALQMNPETWERLLALASLERGEDR